MIFRHCWECMLEVTPSGRAIVDRYASIVDAPGEQQVVLVPVEAESMERLCRASQSVAPPPVEIDWGMTA